MSIKYKTFMTVLFRWIGAGLVIGAFVGTLTTILIKTNDFLGDIRFWGD
jgi:hypothetical protein